MAGRPRATHYVRDHPRYVARNWWERLLYNQSANRLRRVLIGRPHTVVVNVPYRREDNTGVARAAAP